MVESGLQGRRQNFFKFPLAPYNTEHGRIAERGERKICGVSRSAGFGQDTPKQDHHKGENEREANFGTVVKSTVRKKHLSLIRNFTGVKFNRIQKNT